MSADAIVNFLVKPLLKPSKLDDPYSPMRYRAPTQKEIRDLRGTGIVEFDFCHAVLCVREAPRLGARVSFDKQDPLRRYLENKNTETRSPTGKIVFATDNFLMTSFVELDSERFIPVYNFSTPVVQTSSSSGRSTRVYNYQGTLLFNSIEGSSYAEFQIAYLDWLRASACLVGTDRQLVPYVVELTYRDQIRRGYLLSLTIDHAATVEHGVSFSFTLFVVHESSKAVVEPTLTGSKTKLQKAVETSQKVTDAPVWKKPAVEEFTA